jgi:hypothetical protein
MAWARSSFLELQDMRKPSPATELRHDMSLVTVGHTVSHDTRTKLYEGLCKIWKLVGDDAADLKDLCDSDDCLADLLVIHGLLAALFRDEAVERDWLSERRKVFDGLSAMMLILDGKASLQRVRQMVGHMSGQ